MLDKCIIEGKFPKPECFLLDAFNFLSIQDFILQYTFFCYFRRLFSIFSLLHMPP